MYTKRSVDNVTWSNDLSVCSLTHDLKMDTTINAVWRFTAWKDWNIEWENLNKIKLALLSNP